MKEAQKTKHTIWNSSYQLNCRCVAVIQDAIHETRDMPSSGIICLVYSIEPTLNAFDVNNVLLASTAHSLIEHRPAVYVYDRKCALYVYSCVCVCMWTGASKYILLGCRAVEVSGLWNVAWFSSIVYSIRDLLVSFCVSRVRACFVKIHILYYVLWGITGHSQLSVRAVRSIVFTDYVRTNVETFVLILSKFLRYFAGMKMCNIDQFCWLRRKLLGSLKRC